MQYRKIIKQAIIDEGNGKPTYRADIDADHPLIVSIKDLGNKTYYVCVNRNKPQPEPEPEPISDCADTTTEPNLGVRELAATSPSTATTHRQPKFPSVGGAPVGRGGAKNPKEPKFPSVGGVPVGRGGAAFNSSLLIPNSSLAHAPPYIPP